MELQVMDLNSEVAASFAVIQSELFVIGWNENKC